VPTPRRLTPYDDTGPETAALPALRADALRALRWRLYDDLVGDAGVLDRAQQGTCYNRIDIRRNELETRVLAALRYHLMESKLFAIFCVEFRWEINRVRSAGSAR
jgi:hypothetical protein